MTNTDNPDILFAELKGRSSPSELEKLLRKEIAAKKISPTTARELYRDSRLVLKHDNEKKILSFPVDNDFLNNHPTVRYPTHSDDTQQYDLAVAQHTKDLQELAARAFEERYSIGLQTFSDLVGGASPAFDFGQPQALTLYYEDKAPSKLRQLAGHEMDPDKAAAIAVEGARREYAATVAASEDTVRGHRPRQKRGTGSSDTQLVESRSK